MKKKNRKHNFIVYATNLRMVAFVLILVILLGIVPPISFAAEERVTATDQALSAEETEQVYTYTEILEMRDSFTKHFRRSDGKIVAIVYSEVMHTEKDGEMVDVDNRLSYSKSLGAYRTANDEFAVSFASSASADNTVGIAFEGYNLSWRVDVVRNPLNTSDQTIATKQMALREAKQERASLASIASVDNQAFEGLDTKTTFVKEEITSSFASTSALQYKNAFTGEGSVDLRYTVSHNRVEEDIVINEKSNIRSYVMQITAPDLTAVLSEDDSVSFFNENGDSIFTIGAPWMYDAADEFSIDIEVSLVQDGDSVTVVYTPDSDWLNAKERVYPVVIDPSVKSRNYTSNYVDAYVYTGTTVNDRILTLGYTKSGINTDGKEFETYTTFNSFPNLFAPMQIESAMMTYYAALNRTGQRMRILNKQTDSKTGAKMNWSTDIYNFSFDNRPLGTGAIYTPTVTQVTSSVYAYTYDFTSAIPYSDTYNFFTNYFNGFRVYGTSTTTPSLNLYSSENTSASYRPVLEITYSYMPDIPIQQDGVYQIQNRNSGKRLMTSSTSSSTNVFQFNTSNSSLQAFTFDGADGIYTIHPYSRSSEALTWDYSGSSVQNATNVYLSSATTAKADKQEFLIRCVSESADGYSYYAILSRADTNMALTAYGTGTGSTTGTSTTSSGNVYMSEYTGANSQLWCLYSGGLPLMLGNDIREENGGMYEYDVGVSDVVVQPYCYVTEYGDTVSFSSSDSTAIEVASNGKVTAKNAGQVTLTATVKNSEGTVKNTYSYTVTLKLENGVYYIRNRRTGLYLDVTGASLENGAALTQSTEIADGDAWFGQLWKVYYLGDNMYSIRSMRNLKMGLKRVNDTVALYTMDTTDTRSAIADAAEWNFKSSASGAYRIQRNGKTNEIIEPLENTSGAGVYVGAYNGLTEEYWYLDKVSFSSGIYVFNMVDDIGIGAVHQFSAIHYSENLTSQTIQWSSSNENVAIIDEDTGLLTPLKRGTTDITVQEGNISKTFEVQIVKKAIIIVPGIMGSKLVAGQTVGNITEGEELWSTDVLNMITNGSTFEKLEAMEKLSFLVCKNDGSSEYFVRTVTDYRGLSSPPKEDNYYGVSNRYKELYDALEDEFSDEYEIRFFNYDWRLSNQLSANKLTNYISDNQYDKVVFVTDSMGALVVSKYVSLGSNQRSKVEKNIMIAPPLSGTPIMVYILGNGDVTPLLPSNVDMEGMLGFYNDVLSYAFLNLSSIKTIMRNYQSLYELMPNELYFYSDDGLDEDVQESDEPEGDWYLTTTVLGYLPEHIESYERTNERLSGIVGFNSNLLQNAVEFHDSLFDTEHITSFVDSYYLIGYDKDTVMRLEFDNTEFVVEKESKLGDGIVPIHSANLGERYSTKTYYQNISHDYIAMQEATVSFVKAVINNPSMISVNGIIDHVE